MTLRTKADWSIEAKETISKAFTADNLSYARIASEYAGKLDGGRPLTRNMVAGILSRLGISCRSSGRVHLPSTKLHRPTRTRKAPKTLPTSSAESAPIPAPPKAISAIRHTEKTPRATGAPSLNVMLHALADNGCRFETSQTNDGVSLFCGHQCERLPAPRSGRRFYAFCPEHRLDCEDPKSAAKIRSHNSSTRYLLSRLH